jgi:predicted nucleic acid-binding protein
VTRYLLDTNHVSEAIGRVFTVRDRVQQRHKQGSVFGTCVPVACELLVGVVQRKDADQTRGRFDGLLKVVRISPLDMGSAEH